MLITKNFILLNLPKTGSSFVRAVIKEIYKKKYSYKLSLFLSKLKIIEKPVIELMLPNFQSPIKLWSYNIGQHGAYCQIPKKYLDKEVVSVIRNPYSKFISGYEYGWWKKYPPIEKAIIEERFLNFPDLDLNEYVEMQKMVNSKTNSFFLGAQIIQFIKMFFKDPDNVLFNLNKEYINSSNLFKADIARITFLRQEFLNEDLGNFLLKKRFSNEEVLFAKNYKKVNETVSENQYSRENIWTQEAIDYVNDSERFLFIILKELGFKYECPKLIDRK